MFRQGFVRRLCLRALLSGAVIFFILLSGMPALANPPDHGSLMKQLERTAKSILNMAQSGQYPQAMQQLESYGNVLTQINFAGVTDAEGLNALTTAWMDAKKVFAAIRISPRDSVAAAGMLYLATDSLTHRQRPMWHSFADAFAQSVNNMEQAAKQNNVAGYKTSLAQLRWRYKEIRPAAIISGNRLPIYKADSLFVYMDSELARPVPDKLKLAEAAGQLRQVFAALFAEEDRQAFLPLTEARNPLVWSVGIGSIIIAVLVFVGWKKFKYGKPYSPVRRQD